MSDTVEHDGPVSGDVPDHGVDVAAAREVLRSCVCSRTRMLDRILTGLYDEALEPIGLRVNQLTMLALIASMAGLRAVDVGRFLEMDKSTVSRALASLRKSGWVEAVRRSDEAGTTLTLTPLGADLLRRAMPRWRQAGVEAEKTLGAEGVEALRRAADTFLTRRAKS